MKCRICEKEGGHKTWVAREMMIGLREEFAYFECANCGCVQINEIPENMGKYYASNYYSLNSNPEVHFKGFLKRKIKKWRDYSLITGKDGLGALLQRIIPNQMIELANFSWVRLKKSDKILDVGCGSGTIPYIFKNAGFKTVHGIDPYIEKDIEYKIGLKVEKKSLLKFPETEKWDLIMFNHSFEHIEEPIAHLVKVRSLLTDGGACVIRIPSISSFAWREYKTNWVQWDAPRHFFLYSKQSLKFLADRSGLEIERVTCESTAFQFIGSEQYKLDISLFGDSNSYYKGNSNLFNKAQLNSFAERTHQLNQDNDGDSIAVILRKTR